MNQAEQHYQKMVETPVRKLILSLAIPTIISMLISMIYNLADTYFVGSLGVSASGAVSVVFTLMTILQALGFMLGHGSGSVISRLLADKNTATASVYASTGFFLSVVFGLITILLGLPFLSPLMRLLGSTETILSYSRSYGLYIILAAPMLMGSIVLNNILRYEGKALYGMIGLTLGGVLNMAGDPLFIYGFKMGVDGAGLSTALSQTVSFVVLVILFCKHAQSRLSLRSFARDGRTVLDIITTGFPNLFRQGLTSVSNAILNNCAGAFSDACVSAMGITARCQGLMLSIAMGLCQGFQPVAGFNFQAHKYKRLRDSFSFVMRCSVLLLALLGGIGALFAPRIVVLFQDDPEVLRIGTLALRFAGIALLFTVFNIAPSMLFQTCGQKKLALLTASLRGGLCFIPVVLILAPTLGELGIQLSQPIADVLTGFMSFPLAISFLRSLPKDDITSTLSSPSTVKH